MKALNFWTWYKSIYFDSISKTLYACDDPFCEMTYSVPFLDGLFLNCDTLPVSNDPVFKNENTHDADKDMVYAQPHINVYTNNKLQRRFQASPISNRYNNRLQASSSREVLRLTYTSGSLALKMGLPIESQQLPASKPPVEEHSGSPMQVGSCTGHRATNGNPQSTRT